MCMNDNTVTWRLNPTSPAEPAPTSYDLTLECGQQYHYVEISLSSYVKFLSHKDYREQYVTTLWTAEKEAKILASWEHVSTY